ncbi:hypothetical protein [Burkholderia sp. F1]|uniref:hypothetical protein n=1 Tax=Burkholderia sp. F1 TaxID=3366817 RepID=UPI003D756369
MQALFLGAGSSYDCAMPLVSELTAEIKRWLTPDKIHEINEHQKSHQNGWSDDIVAMLISRLQNSQLHYESIIGAIEVDFAREQDAGRRGELHGLHAFLLQTVHGLLLDRQLRNFDFAMAALDSFGGIRSLMVDSKPLWVFSLNHDVMFELLAAKFSIPLKTGFHGNDELQMNDGSGGFTAINVAHLSRQAINANDYDFFKPGETGVNLIKLHGSLDIFGSGDELSYIKIAAKENRAASYVEQLETVAKIDLALGKRDGVRAVNEHTYLDHNGQLQFLRNSLLSGAHKFSPKISQIAPPEFLSLFRGYLNYSSHLVCIGYGFGDRHIDEGIVDWLSFSGDRQLTVVNPGIKQCPGRLNHLFDQVTLRAEGAAEYFLELRQEPERPSQKFWRALREKGRERIKDELLNPK